MTNLLMKDKQQGMVEKMKNKPFIKTTDKETAQKLRSLGFQEIDFDGSFYTFINNKEFSESISFADNKIIYSEILHI